MSPRVSSTAPGTIEHVQVTVDRSGRLVIPQAIREEAGIEPGMTLDIRVNDGRIEIERPSEVRLVRQGRFITAVAPPGIPR